MKFSKIIRTPDSGSIPGFEQMIKALTSNFPGSGFSSGSPRTSVRGVRGVFRPRTPGNGTGIGDQT
jgi:hypothetical protein